jgi:hypothetical protein
MKILVAAFGLVMVLAIALVTAATPVWDRILLETGWGLPTRVGPPLLIIGHHGDVGAFPENTAEGIWAAAALRPDGIEIDVQRSASGTWYAMHDLTLDRTTDRRGSISDLPDVTIDSAVIDAGLGFDPDAVARFHIARLEAVLGGLRDFRGTVYLDPKDPESGDVASLLELTKGMGVAFICPTPAYATAVKALDPRAETILGMGYPRSADVDGLFLNAARQATSRLMADRTLPLTVYVAESQFGQDEYALLRTAWATGVKAFITNNLPAALAIRDGFIAKGP